MKKISKFLFIVSVLFLGISCKKSDNECDSESNVKELTKNVGKYHNEGLDYLFKKLYSLNPNKGLLRAAPSGEISSEAIVTASYEYVQSIPEFTEIPFDANIKEHVQELDAIRDDLTFSGVQNIWSSITNDNSFKSSVPLSEQNAISEVNQIFVNLSTSNLSPEQWYNYIKNNAMVIQSKYNLQGEAVCGLLSIMNSSNEYWHNASSLSVTTPSDPPIPLDPIIVEADCVGYLFGWGRAFWDDQTRFNNQKDFSNNANNRIMAGLWSAMSVSFVKALPPLEEPIDELPNL